MAPISRNRSAVHHKKIIFGCAAAALVLASHSIIRHRPDVWADIKKDFKAAHGQDIWLIDHVFKEKGSVNFVEAGSYNGVTGSNVYALEKHFGWRGLCYEPNPTNYKMVVKQRPLCKKINGVICKPDMAGKKVTYSTFKEPYDQESGIVEFMDGYKQDRVNSLPLESKISLPCRDMSKDVLDILGKKKATHLDVLFLDVEGAELSVLQSLDFTSFRVQILLVECSHEKEVIEYLTAKPGGYIHVAKVGDDNIFFRNDGEYVKLWREGCNCEECKKKLIYPDPNWLNCEQ